MNDHGTIASFHWGVWAGVAPMCAYTLAIAIPSTVWLCSKWSHCLLTGWLHQIHVYVHILFWAKYFFSPFWVTLRLVSYSFPQHSTWNWFSVLWEHHTSCPWHSQASYLRFVELSFLGLVFILHLDFCIKELADDLPTTTTTNIQWVCFIVCRV